MTAVIRPLMRVTVAVTAVAGVYAAAAAALTVKVLVDWRRHGWTG